MKMPPVRTSTFIQGAVFLCIVGLHSLPVCGQETPRAHHEAETHFARGRDLYRAGNYKEAIESYDRAVAYKPADADQLYNMSLAHLQLGRYLEAARLLENSVRLQPQNTASLTVLGALYTYFGRYVEAEKALRQVIGQGRPSVEVFNNLGVAYYRAGRDQQAVEAFHQAAKLAPAEAVIYHNLSKARLKLGQTSEAYEAKRRADLLGPRNISNSGVILLLNGPLKLELQTRDNPPEMAKASGSEKAGPGVEGESGGEDAARDLSGEKLTEVYRVGEGDVLDIKQQGVASASSTLYTVLAGGLLEYPPLGGPVTVAGLTTDEIAHKLESELRRRGATAGPPLIVNTREYASHNVLVSGLVESRGAKILRREAVPLYVIMAEAQPLREACRAVVNSYATGKAVGVLLTELHREGVLVRPGDVVHVEACEPEFFYISGKVAEPGEKKFRRGLTLTQAIVSSGGLLKVNKFCVISREGAGGKLITLRYDLRHLTSGIIADPLLQAGDRVEVF